MNKRKAKKIAKGARAIANRIKRIKSSNKPPNDAELFNAGGFVLVNKDSSSMLMQIIK
ncbi:hypothetical protein L4C31_15450 [Aliivibrio sifiae]